MATQWDGKQDVHHFILVPFTKANHLRRHTDWGGRIIVQRRSEEKHVKYVIGYTSIMNASAYANREGRNIDTQPAFSPLLILIPSVTLAHEMVPPTFRCVLILVNSSLKMPHRQAQSLSLR